MTDFVENSKSFEKLLFTSSVPLVRLGENLIPNNLASGTLVDYIGKRFLLTVEHATGDQGNWAIQLRYDSGEGTQNYQLGSMHFLAKGTTTSKKLTVVDFSYVEVPIDLIAFRQQISEANLSVEFEAPIVVHSLDFDTHPDATAEYGFCGTVLPTQEEHFGSTFFGSELRVYTGLRFDRTEEDMHWFSLPFKHPGHEHFRGCSGAPILDRAGNVVALVAGGCETRNEIRGISISKYRVALDLLAREEE